MFERSELALKILCGAMALLVLYRLVLAVAHINPLYHLAIPALPALSSAATTNTSSTTNNSAIASKPATNGPQHAMSAGATNSATRSTNLVSRPNDHGTAATNSLARSSNVLAQATNLIAGSTNPVAQSTNLAARATNSLAQATNSSQGSPNNKAGPPLRSAELRRRGMPGGSMPGMREPGPELPPEIQVRIDHVIDSEIIAPVMHPLPMALLGIAGKDVFLRAPNGQTGLIKEGEELGGVKLVRIGVNRILIEEQGERKELTIFAGLGSESLMSTQKDSPK